MYNYQMHDKQNLGIIAKANREVLNLVSFGVRKISEIFISEENVETIPIY